MAFGATSYCAHGEMVPSSAGSNVKGMEFRIPRLTSCPSVSCSIDRDDVDASVLVVYSLKINDDLDFGDTIQIAIETTTLDGSSARGRYICSIVAIDKPQLGATLPRVETRGRRAFLWTRRPYPLS